MQTSGNDVTGAPRVNAFLFLWGRSKEHPLARGGPGLITGVADDDSSGIAAYSQAGAQFGLNILWTMPLAYPHMGCFRSSVDLRFVDNYPFIVWRGFGRSCSLSSP
jgi:hypothetical protein